MAWEDRKKTCFNSVHLWRQEKAWLVTIQNLVTLYVLFFPPQWKTCAKKKKKKNLFRKSFLFSFSKWNRCFNKLQNYRWIFYCLPWNSEHQMSSKPKALPHYKWRVFVYIHCIKIDNKSKFMLVISVIFLLYWHSLLCLFRNYDIFHLRIKYVEGC